MEAGNTLAASSESLRLERSESRFRTLRAGGVRFCLWTRFPWQSAPVMQANRLQESRKEYADAPVSEADVRATLGHQIARGNGTKIAVVDSDSEFRRKVWIRIITL